MNNQDFSDICRFVYGYGWQPVAAEKLSINIRTIQYWSAGKKKIPDDIAEEVLAQAADRLIGIRGRLEV